jgi:BirA family biotin operon repressor/biotin-[acetyl-CoA-carboxylase] ligase
VYSNVGLLRENYFTNLLFNGQMREYADENGKFLGKIVDVENDGHLIIEDMEGNKRRYAFKGVTFLLSTKC